MDVTKETGETPEENIDDLKAQLAIKTEELNNVVGELKEDRQKRQQMKDEIDQLKSLLEDASKANTNKDPNDVSVLIEQALEKRLGERDATMAKSNRTLAIEKFVNENKSFHPENDPTGKRREALEGAIERFNSNGLVSVEDFYKLAKDAARLLGNDTVPTNTEQPVEVPNMDTPITTSTPRVASDGDVTAAEKNLYESNGWTKERYLALRAKNPDFIRTLLGATQL